MLLSSLVVTAPILQPITEAGGQAAMELASLVVTVPITQTVTEPGGTAALALTDFSLP